MTRVIKSFRQFTTSLSGSVFSCFSFTLLFLLVLIEPRCNYIFCVISLASLLVSWQLMEAERELSQNALHLVTGSNICPVKCALVSVCFFCVFFAALVSLSRSERVMSFIWILLGLDWQLFQPRNSVNETMCSGSTFDKHKIKKCCTLSIHVPLWWSCNVKKKKLLLCSTSK